MIDVATHLFPPDTNPYAASAVAKPQAEPAALGVGIGVWRDGDFLVLHREAVLPDICLRTGLPATRRLAHKIAFGGSFFRPGVAVTIEPPLCKQQYFLVQAGWWLLALGVTGLFGLAIAVATLTRLRPPDAGPLILTVMVLLGVVLVTGGLLCEVVYVRRWRGDYVWLRGASGRFLEKLPPWTF